MSAVSSRPHLAVTYIARQCRVPVKAVAKGHCGTVLTMRQFLTTTKMMMMMMMMIMMFAIGSFGPVRGFGVVITLG